MEKKVSNLSVLAFDDDKFIRKLLSEILSNDYDFKAAENLSQFNTFLNQQSPDIVLLDVEMPEINGLQVCSQLRKKGFDSFIVIMSANDDEKTIKNAYDYGADDYIRKPFIPFEMKAKINLISNNISYSNKLEAVLKNQKKFNDSLFKLGSIISNNTLISDKDELLESLFQATAFIKVNYSQIYLKDTDSFHELYFDDKFKNISFDTLKNKASIFKENDTRKQTIHFKTHDEPEIYCHIRRIAFNNKNAGFLILQSRNDFNKQSFEMLSLYMDFINLKGSGIIKENILRDEIKKERRELNKVRSIQVSLLPDFEEIQNFDVASTFIPMDEISGDFFDGYYVSDNIYQITLCDVSGHGIASSYVGSSIRGILRSAAKEASSASEIVTYLNNQIFTGFKDIYYFSTLVLCRMNITSGEISLVSAGHPPCYIYSHEKKTTESINNTGPLIGLMENAVFDEIKINMKKDDILLFYTDGISEATPPDSDKMYGNIQLYDTFQSNTSLSAIEIVHSVLGDVYEYKQYSPFEDDVTILCIKRKL